MRENILKIVLVLFIIVVFMLFIMNVEFFTAGVEKIFEGFLNFIVSLIE